MKQIIQVVLACRHTLEFVATHAPGPDETELWCRKCGKMVYRFGELDPWVLKCMSCQYARNLAEINSPPSRPP